MAELNLTALIEEYALVTNQEKEAAFRAKIQNIIKSQTVDEMMATLRAIDNRLTELEQIVKSHYPS
jgi:crotonobetainyl-CoA:carnitine CoA-transferase CaiB-like acyl-CoA transferase